MQVNRIFFPLPKRKRMAHSAKTEQTRGTPVTSEDMMNAFKSFAAALMIGIVGLVAANPARAELNIVIYSPVIEPMPFAIPTFVDEGGAGDYAASISRVVAADLAGTGLFREIPAEAHISGISAFDAPIAYNDWQAINAQALIVGAVQASGDHRRHGQVGVDIGTGAARLEPGRLGRAGNDAKARCAVVDSPGGLDRCPKAIDQALVAVDGGPEHRRKLHQAGDLAGQVAFKQRAHAALAAGVVKQIGLAVRQALVDMPGAARVLLRPLGHEAGHDAKTLADLFGAGLEQDRPIGRLQRA
jgi:hypothetical protein